MSASQYSLTGTIFYIGYLVFEYPHNRLMQRSPLGKYISVSVIIWGAILPATAGTDNAAGVLAVRFFLGGLEDAVTTGVSMHYGRTRLRPDYCAVVSVERAKLFAVPSGSHSTEWLKLSDVFWHTGSHTASRKATTVSLRRKQSFLSPDC